MIQFCQPPATVDPYVTLLGLHKVLASINTIMKKNLAIRPLVSY